METLLIIPERPSPSHPMVTVALPAWVDDVVDWDRVYATDEDRMRLAIDLSRHNVLEGTGGPFGAAVFQAVTGRLVAVGVNSVVRLGNCTLHAEMVAFMLAQKRVGSFSLAGPGQPAHELATSCDPCAMCLGATLWSGVRRVICGAGRDDAERAGFDEGPVFPASHDYLRERGVQVQCGILREEAARVLDLYRSRSGLLYNGSGMAG